MFSKISFLVFFLFLNCSVVTYSIEISSISFDASRNTEAAIEFVDTMNSIRYQGMSYLYDYASKKTGHSQFFLTGIVVIADTLFSSGSNITIHEVGHAEAAGYHGATDISFLSGNYNNLTMFELYYFSSLHFTAATQYRINQSFTPYMQAWISGAGVNSANIAAHHWHIKSLKKGYYDYFNFVMISSSKLNTLTYAFIDPDSSSGNDFGSYIDHMSDQGYSISIEDIRNQLVLTTLLSGSMNISNRFVALNSQQGFFQHKSNIDPVYKYKKVSLYHPEFYTFLMPDSLTLWSEFYINHDHAGLFSVGVEEATFGKSKREYSLGWYPTIKNVDAIVRVVYSDNLNPFFVVKAKYWIHPKLALSGKVFHGDRTTNAQMRDYISDDTAIILGLSLNLN